MQNVWVNIRDEARFLSFIYARRKRWIYLWNVTKYSALTLLCLAVLTVWAICGIMRAEKCLKL